MNIKEVIENSKKNKITKVYMVFHKHGLIVEYDCVIIPTATYTIFNSCNYQIILTNTSNELRRVINKKFTKNEIKNTYFREDSILNRTYYLNKKDAIEYAYSYYTSIRQDAEYGKKSIIKLADEETIEKIKEFEDYFNRQK